jgi:putative ABC transport system permease protein
MNTSVAFYLAFKELWRRRGRFFLVSLVIALITLLVIFLAALGEGLANGNKEYISKLTGELVLYQEQANLSISASQLGRSTMNNIRRLPGIQDAGAIGVSSAFIEYDGAPETESTSLIGVEPGRPGEPIALRGQQLSSLRGNEAIIGRNVAQRTGLTVGDTLTVNATQGTLDEQYPLEIVGVSDGQQYFIQPSVIVPLYTWDRIRPKSSFSTGPSELTFNIVNVKLDDSQQTESVAQLLPAQVNGIEAVDIVTAYEATPGYIEQESTLNTQRGFTLLIGILVVGGFFQIQTLQKVGQVGMLKALGASNLVVGLGATLQILTVNTLGVIIGGFATLLLAMFLPPSIPIVFIGQEILVAVLTLLIIGPLGGMVSIRYLLRVEPLTALGLAS